MTSNGDDSDFGRMQEAILRKEDDINRWCPSSGENVGSMIEFPRTDEWHIVCPTCGTRWAGGSAVLNDHNIPDSR
jgi:hypothetical protein